MTFQSAFLVRTRNLILLIFSALSLSVAATPLVAQTATTTTLSGASSANAQTLVATVRDSGNNLVTVGSVTFNTTVNGHAEVLGTVQLVRNTSKGFALGTATLKTMVGPGSHNISATYNGTKAYRSSSSSASAVTVTSGYGELVSFTASGGPGNYTLTNTVTVSGAGLQSTFGTPAGTVNFFDLTTGNSLLGGAALGNVSTTGIDLLSPQTTANFNRPYPGVIATGDFNNDGKLDVAVVTSATDQSETGYVQILLGNGDGTFTLRQTVQVGSAPGAIVAWDLNGDGVLDMAVSDTWSCGGVNAQCGHISILTGNGDGTFSSNIDALQTGDNPLGLAIGDLNGDGIPDIAVANSGNWLLQCNPPQSQNGAPYYPQSPQVYHDSTISYFIANGDGSFQGQQAVFINYPSTDTTQCQYSGPPGPGGLGGYYRNLPDNDASLPYAVAMGDFEGTGNNDVAVIDGGYDRVFMLHNDGSGNLSLMDPSLYHWNIGSFPTSVAMGDVNNDGHPDLVVVNSNDNSISVLVGCGNPGSCGSPSSNLFPTQHYYLPGAYGQNGQPTGTINVSLADVNGDGNLDIVVQNENEFTVSVFLGNGNGTFAGPWNFTSGDYPRGLAVGDFNGDGLPDVMTSTWQQSPANASVMLNFTGSMTATATLSGVNIPALGNPTHTVQAAYGFSNMSGGLTGNANYAPMYANTLSLYGSLVNTSVSLSPSPSTGVVAGRVPVTLSANITPTNDAGFVPTGTVTFYDGGASLGSATVSGAGASIPPIFFSGVGTHNLMAIYSGDANFGSSLVGYALAVNAYIPPGTTSPLAASPNGTGNCGPPGAIAATCVFNGHTQVLLTATVGTTPSALSGNTLTGSVTFYDGACSSGTNLGTALLGPTTMSGATASASASVQTLFNTVGTHSLCAKYFGDSNFAASSGPAQSLVVSQYITPTATTLTRSGGTTPGSVQTLVASVKDNLNNTITAGVVTFYDGPIPLGTAQILSSGNATLGYAANTAGMRVRLTSGQHSITAVFQARTNGHFAGSTSPSQPVTIKSASGIPSTVVLSASQDSPYTLTANLSANAVNTPTGTVSFIDQTDGNSTVATSALGNFAFSFDFNPPVTLPVGVLPVSVSGDFNGDGFTDIAVASASTNTIQIQLGQAGGTFTNPANLNVCNPTGMIVADFNSDGFPDLAVVSRGLPSGSPATCPTVAAGGDPTDASVVVFLGNGNGTFTYKTTLGTAGAKPIEPFAKSIAAGDLNGDGIPDLAVAHPISNPTSGGWGVLGAVGRVGIMLGNGDGTFGAESTYNPDPSSSFSNPTVLAIMDYDGDGYQDVVIADSAAARLEAMLGKGDGTLTVRANGNNSAIDVSSRDQACCSAYDGIRDLVVGDFNGDGLTDFALLDTQGQQVVVWLTNSNHTFGSSPSFFTASPPATSQQGPNYTTTPSGMAVADLNGDGIADLLITNVNASPCPADAGACIRGSMAPHLFYAVTASYFYDSTNISVLYGTRAGTFQNLSILPGSFLNVPPDNYGGTSYTNQYGYVSAVSGDFNGDGFVDVAALNNIPANTPDVSVVISGDVINGGCCNAEATATVTGGSVTGITLTEAGTGYGGSGYTPPDCRIFSATGSGATCSCAAALPDLDPSYIPAVVASDSGGSLSPSSYQVVTSYWDQYGEAPGSNQASVTVSSNTGELLITAPPPVIGASGYKIYVTDPITSYPTGTTYLGSVTVTGWGNATITTRPTDGNSPLPTYINRGSPSSGALLGCAITNGGSNYTTSTIGPSLYVFTGHPTVTASAQAAPIVIEGGGQHNVIASYAGDTNYSPASSPAIQLTGTPIFVTETLNTSVTGSTAGSTATLTASISPFTLDTLIATGTITFYDGATQIGAPITITNGSAVVTTAPLAGGTHVFTASYSGDTNFLSATATATGTGTFVVNPATTTTAISVPSSSTAGNSVTIRATVAPATSGGFNASGTITFFDGASQIGTPQALSGGVATLMTTKLAAGSHSLTAQYSGDDNFGASVSGAASVAVSTISTTLALAVDPSSAPAVGATVTLTATVSPSSSGAFNAGGTVNFYDGGKLIGQQSVTSGQAQYVISQIGVGTHTFSAVYTGDSNFVGSSSPTLAAYTITQIATTTALTASPAPVITGGTTTLTATVNPSTSFNDLATGTVTFKDGGVSIGTAALDAVVNGQAQFTTSALTTGVHNFTASYPGDTNFAASQGSLAVTAVAPPTLSKSFAASSVPLNGSIALSFTVTNPNTTTALTGIGFTDTLPAGLVVSTPNGLSGSCNGTTPSATAGASSISLVAAGLAANGSCTFSINVTGTIAGAKNNTTGIVTSVEGGNGTTASASIAVVAPPSIAKVFGVANLPLNTTTSLTFTITNPTVNTVAQTGVAFVDVLPAGLAVTNGTSSVCSGANNLTVSGGNTITLSNTAIAVAGNCVFSVTVTGTASGNLINTTGAVSSTNGGAGNTASANITVAAPPAITKTFGAVSIPLNGATSLTFAISNPNTAVDLSGIGFSDTLPAGLVVSTSPALISSCGGSATAAAGTGSVSLSGGTLAANTSSSCTVSLSVTGTTAGVKSSGASVSSTEGGAGNTSTASVIVVASPTLQTTFGAASIPLTGSTSLSFTINNPNPAITVNGIAFSDTLPAGLAVSTPNSLTGSCGGGTITAAPGTGTVSLSGASLAASGSCTFSVSVTGTAAGTQNTTTNAITSTEGATGATASASIYVVAPPSIAKVFSPTTISLNATTALTFTVTNPSVNTVTLTGVAFTDTLPAGLTVVNSSASTCGGTLTSTAPTGIALSGASIATNSQCQFSVTVTGAASGQYTNTTGNAASTNGGTGNTATATLTVASPPTIANVFGAATIPMSGITTLTFNVANPNTGVALTGIAFTDNLPAGLVVAATPNLSSSCGGTATAVAGSSLVSLTGGTLAFNANCAVSVNVIGTTAGMKNNSVQVTSTEGGAGNTSNANITVVAPPVLVKSFGAASIPVSGSTSLTFTINNANGSTTLTGVAFSDNLPAGLVVSTPNSLTGSCGGGTVTAVAGTGTVSLSGTSLAAGGSCSFSVSVTGTAAGTQNNTTSAITSTEGATGATASASIYVVAPPSIAKAFSPATISLNATTTLTFTVTNPAANTTNLVGVAFTDALPAGLTVANSSASVCGGTLTTTAPTGIALLGASIATNSQCQFSVTVTGTTSGQYTSTTGNVASTNGGTGNMATANLTVASPPTITSAFGAATIPLNGTTSLTFTVQDPNAGVALTGIAFTDNLPPGLVVASPSNLSNNCGGTATAVAGSSLVNLTGGTQAASASCTVSVHVQGATAGVKNNSVPVTSTEGGAGNTSNASVTVVAPPAITNLFGATSIPLNGTTSLSFTINNSNTTQSLSGVAFSDTLPAGPVVSTPNGLSGSCGGGTVTAAPGTGTVSLSGASLAASGSCTFSVSVTGTAAGTQNNTTSAITSTEGATGATASASIYVVAPPSIAKAFNPTPISLNATTSLLFTITNPAANTVALTGVAFTDTLPAGLTVANTSAAVCGGTLTTTAPTAIVLSGASAAINSQCQFSVTVTGAVSGIYTNTTGNVSSTNGGAGNTATANLTVASPPAIATSFGAATIPLNGTTTLTFNVTNPNSSVALTGIAFTDNLPTGLVVAATPNLNNTCGGTATAVGSSISLAAGTLAFSTNCTVSVNVTGTTAGVKNNSVPVTSTEGGTGNTSNANITVVAPAAIVKSFGAASIPLNGSTSLSFTINNPNTTQSLSGVTFSDTLPAGLAIAMPNGQTGTCGGGTITAAAGSNVASLSAATIAASGSCTFSINVTGMAAGTQNNTTGSVTSTEGSTGGTASASIAVVAPPSIAKVFNPTPISLNATTSLTFTITNPAANTVALTGVAFTDTLPTGLTVANSSSSVCGGTLTTTAPTGIVLSGANVAINSQCQFGITVTGAVSGIYTNTTGNVTSTNGGAGNTATANLTVASPPAIASAFGAATIPLNGTTTLTFNVTNPNTSVALTGIAFTDNLPTGLVVAATPNLNNTCGGTATAVGSSISLAAGTLAFSTNCTVSVNVTGTTSGVKNNSVPVTSTEGGTGNTSNANITVVAPAAIVKSFGAASIPLNGSTSLSFTINNPNTTQSLSGVTFSDTLPAGLVITAPNGQTGTCGGGTITAAAGSNVASLSAATIAASGSCTFSINVTGMAAGTQNNTTGNVTSTEGGTGGTASASIAVVAPPSIAKVFNPTPISLNATTSLTFTITNPAANTVALTGVAFTDTLPTGLTVANSSSSVCGGTLTTTVPTGIVLSGANVAINSQCQFGITVTGAASGIFTNTTGNVSSTNGGTGNTAIANLTVASPPAIANAFGAATIPLNGTTTLTFNVTNPNANVALTGIAFTDNLPAGLVVASTTNLSDTCGGTVTAAGGSGSVSLAAGTLAFSANCMVSLNVTGTTAGVKNNSVPVTSTEGGAGNTSNASITVVAPPVLATSFGAASIPLNGSTPLTFTVDNPNGSTTLTGVAFSDTLPAGLVVATPNGLTGSCGGGSIAASASSGTISLSAATLAASGRCTFSINVIGTGGGTKNNTTSPATSTEGGTGVTASASIVVVAPPSISTTFTPNVIAPNTNSTLSFTITNPAANTAALMGVGFTDTLPANVVVAAPNGLTGSCGGGTITAAAGAGSISLSGATIAASGSCTFSVIVTSATIGNYSNTTAAVTSTNGGTGNTASVALAVQVADLIVVETHSGNFIAGQSGATYTIVVKNSGLGPTAGPVNLVDTLPPQMTATAIGGTGWACTLATTTCTRSDVLAPGASYPPITMVGTLGLNIALNFTNTATVSGGGETNTGNDTANDTATIGPPLSIAPHDASINYLVLPAGRSGTILFDVTSNASPQMTNITFVCNGLPAGATCSFTEQGESLPSDQVMLTISSDGPHSAAAPQPSFGGYGKTVYVAFLLPLLGLGFGRKTRKARLRLIAALTSLALFLVLAGCGGGFPAFTTPQGIYPVTITATGTSGTATASAITRINLSVRP